MLKLIDLARVAEIGRSIGAITVADNTFASPYVQRPLEHGFEFRNALRDEVSQRPLGRNRWCRRGGS